MAPFPASTSLVPGGQSKVRKTKIVKIQTQHELNKTEKIPATVKIIVTLAAMTEWDWELLQGMPD